MWNPVEKIRDTYNATVAELKKCTWPTRDELKESTVVVIVSVIILSAFVFVVDRLAQGLVGLLTGAFS